MKTPVAIVDDHVLLSQAISGLVNSFPNFRTIYTCKNGQELLSKLKNNTALPEIILMDINMPLLNGIETTKELKEKYPYIKVIALSVEENESTVLDMIRAGAKGYLMKDIEKNILQKALNEVLEKGYYHTNTVTEILLDAINLKPTISPLKEREIEFIKLACTEKNYKDIASEMFVSPKTIEGYRDSIYNKLHIKNRIGLILYAIKNGIFIP